VLTGRAAIIQRMAAQVNGRLSVEEQIDVSPHVLRHTFLRKLAETKGSTMPARLPAIRATATSGATSSRISRH